MDHWRPRLKEVYQRYFDQNRVDALIMPATPMTAKNIEGSEECVTHNGQKVSTFETFIRNSDPASNAGIPSLVIPIGKDGQGLPIALQLDGSAGSDRQLLAIGAALQVLLHNLCT